MMKDFKLSFVDKFLGFLDPEAAVRRVTAKAALHQFSFDAARATNRRAQAPQNINPNDFQKQHDRLQLMREAEDLENNFAPAKTLNRKYAMYVAPIGYHAQTGDAGLNRDVEDYLSNVWFPECDITGRYDFWQMLYFGVIGKNRGGDYGWAFMRPGAEEGMPEDEIVKLPLRIQGVEPDRIGGVYQNVVSENYIAGVVIGRYGEPIAYRVFRRHPAVGQYIDPVDVPADQFVHYTDPLRVDMYRGVSMLDTAVMAFRDLYEWFEFLKGKAKLASALTVFTNSQGSVAGAGAMDPYASNNFDNGQGGLQQDVRFGQINHLPAGAAIEFPDTTTPGGESQYLILQLLKFCAMSYNLPYSFALDATEMGGVSSRLESEQARAEFERGQAVLAPKAHRIKNAALIDAIAKGIFPSAVANKITLGRWSYRAHPTPDLGREASANVSLFQNGLLNPMSYWRDQAQDAEAVARDMSRWTSIKKAAAAEFGNSVEEVFGLGPIASGVTKPEQDPSDPNQNVQPTKMQLKKKEPPKKKVELSPEEKAKRDIRNEKLQAVWRSLKGEPDFAGDENRSWAAAYKIVDKGFFKWSEVPAEIKKEILGE
jgi:capsid protein